MFSFKRWIPTFLAFPVAGYVAIETIGGAHDAASAAAGGLLVGAIVGGAQALALCTGARWAAATAVATSAGAALAVTVTGAGTAIGDVVLAGAITGAVVGAAQGVLLGRRHVAPRGALVVAWAAITAGSWALGWLTTANVIVDLDRGHHVFGSSGALIVTLVTGVALRHVLGARPAVTA